MLEAIRVNNEACIAAFVLIVRERRRVDKDNGERYLHLQLPFATAFIHISVRPYSHKSIKINITV